MPLRFGTSHFVSREAAIRYYRPYGYDNAESTVDRKLKEGEIRLGPPEVPPGEQLGIDEDGRYYLEKS